VLLKFGTAAALAVFNPRSRFVGSGTFAAVAMPSRQYLSFLCVKATLIGIPS
jgi:hypothetical protein